MVLVTLIFMNYFFFSFHNFLQKLGQENIVFNNLFMKTIQIEFMFYKGQFMDYLKLKDMFVKTCL